MSDAPANPGANPDAAGPVRSLHLLRERSTAPAHPAAGLPKPDRLLVGVIAGVAIFFLLGRALGLGRQREDHAAP